MTCLCTFRFLIVKVFSHTKQTATVIHQLVEVFFIIILLQKLYLVPCFHAFSHLERNKKKKVECCRRVSNAEKCVFSINFLVYIVPLYKTRFIKTVRDSMILSPQNIIVKFQVIGLSHIAGYLK